MKSETQSPYVLMTVEAEPEEQPGAPASMSALGGMALSLLAAFAATILIIFLISIALKRAKKPAEK